MITKIITITLMTAFYICYFMKMISQKKRNKYRPTWERKSRICKVHRNSSQNNYVRITVHSTY